MRLISSFLSSALLVSPSFASPVGLISPTSPSPPSSSWNCTLEAWVRAPDLRPNSILPADVRVVANGTDCVDLRGWSVGLRMRERAVVKLRAAEVALPPAPMWNETEENAFYESREMSRLANDLFESESWRWERREESPYRVAEKAYRQALQNRSLWEAHAAEREVFTAEISMETFEDEQDGLPLYTLKSFDVAVPNVNFPPALADSNVHYSGREETDYTNLESRFEFYVSTLHKNGSSLDFVASRAIFLPDLATSTVPPAKEHDVMLTVVPPVWNEDCPRCDEKGTTDNTSTYAVKITLPNEEPTFEAGTTVFLPVTVSRLTGTQRPYSLYITAASQSSSTWAASFAHSDEQAKTLAAGRGFRFRDWTSPLVTDHSKPFEETLEDEAQAEVKERVDNRNGVYQIFHERDIKPNATMLDVELDEQTVLVNLTLPESLYPTLNTTFSSILSHLHVTLKTHAPKNDSAPAPIYPLLSDLEDREAWVGQPYNHITKLADFLDPKSSWSNSGVLRLSSNLSITVVPSSNASSLSTSSYTTTSSSSSDGAAPPLWYLDPAALSPVLLPSSSSLPPSALHFPLLSHSITSEHNTDASTNGETILKTKYSREWGWSRGEKWGGADEVAGRLWERKVAREREYAEREQKLKQEQGRKLVVQA